MEFSPIGHKVPSLKTNCCIIQKVVIRCVRKQNAKGAFWIGSLLKDGATDVSMAGTKQPFTAKVG